MDYLLQAALTYVELGYRVFPCMPGTKTPLTEHGHLDAVTDSEQIERWWRKTPSANIGIATAGLLVLDIDGQNGWLSDAPEQALELASAPLSLTPHDGRQYFHRQPADKSWRNTTGRLAPRVDTRADGGYVIAPPSVLAGGKAYRWADDMELDVPPERLPVPPAWLVDQLDRLTTESHSSPRVASGADGSNPIPRGQRNATLARLAGTMRRVGMSELEIRAALLQVNEDRCTPPLATKEVERVATSVSRYEPDSVAVALAEDHFAQMYGPDEPIGCADPGPLDESMLRIPGFVSEVMDYCLQTAPYPNAVMAFCGALALQAFLAGRKVRDPGDNRTNLYLLGLAHSAAGKDWPRKINTRVLHEIGMAECVGERFASGEGIQDSLFIHPCTLFQTDEIDGMLQSINHARDARHENIMSTLLTLYSSANSVFPMRRKAGKELPGAIDQPCLVIFGTAIPTHYYEALSERMLTNGFFARTIILDCGRRGTGQEPSIRDLPRRVLETARWWAGFQPGAGNLGAWHPAPIVVPQSEPARQLLIDARREAEAEYTQAEERNDSVSTTVWGRVGEQARKLALLYAVSEHHVEPEIGPDAARWAVEFVMHQTRRMLYMAEAHVADNPFHANCLNLLRRLRESPDGQLPHSVLLKRMKIDAKAFAELINTLEQRGDIAVKTQSTGGRPSRCYQLVDCVEDTVPAGGEKTG